MKDSAPTTSFASYNESGPGIGTILRVARQRRGEDLHDVSETLRIRYPYLLAIEDENFAELPGKTYAIGFVRAYADYLGLDSEDIVIRFKGESAQIKSASDLHFPVPMAESSFPTGPAIAIGVFLIAVVYGLWAVSSSDDTKLADLIPALPERMADLLPGGGGGSEDGESATQTAMNDAAPADQESLSGGQGDVPVPSIETAAEAEPAPASEPVPEPVMPAQPATEMAQPEPTPVMPAARVTTAAVEPPAPPVMQGEPEGTDGEPDADMPPEPPVAIPSPPIQEPDAATLEQVDRPPQPPAVEQLATAAVVGSDQDPPPVPPEYDVPPQPPELGGDAGASFGVRAPDPRIILRAAADSWIQVRDEARDQLVVTRLLRAGENYNVPDREGLTLVVGNAGGLDIVVDGEMIPRLGPEGTVRRGIVLDADRLRAGTAYGN